MNKNKYNRGDIVSIDGKTITIDNYTYNNGKYEYYCHETDKWYNENEIKVKDNTNTVMELASKPDIVYKDKNYNDIFYLTVSIPINYKIKNNEFEKYEDEFGNEYYENSYNYDGLTEAIEQNTIIQDTINYFEKHGWTIEQKSLG